MGGTRHLGLRPTVFHEDSERSRICKLYGGVGTVWGRHRHRHELNPMYVERLHANGMTFIGRDEKEGETADETAAANVPAAAP